MNIWNRKNKPKTEDIKDYVETDKGVWADVQPDNNENIQQEPSEQISKEINLPEKSIVFPDNKKIQEIDNNIKDAVVETIGIGRHIINKANEKINKIITGEQKSPEEISEENIKKETNHILNNHDLIELIETLITKKINSFQNNNFNEQQLIFLANELSKNKIFILEVTKILQDDILVHTKKIIENKMEDVINQTKKIIQDQKSAEEEYNQINDQLQLHIEKQNEIISNLTIEITLLEDQKEILTQTVNNEQKTLENLTNTCNNLSIERQNLNNQLKNLPIEIEKNKIIINELNNKILLDNETLNSLKKTYQELINDKNTLNDEINNLTKIKEEELNKINEELTNKKEIFMNEISDDIVNQLSTSIKISLEQGLGSIISNLLEKSTETIKNLVDENIKNHNSQQK